MPLLLSMEEDDIALQKAIESGDTDLIHLVVMHLRDKMPPGDFLRIVHGKPVARELFIQYCLENDMETLKDFYYQQDSLADSGNLQV